MTTTGELRAIVEELELVDVGDAAIYLGEEIEGTDRNPGEDLPYPFLLPYGCPTDEECILR